MIAAVTCAAWSGRLPPPTAAEIARLLAPDSGAMLDGQPLGGAHIAVLVRKHRQGRLILDALRQAGVGGVLYGAGSVFAGRMATELLRVLWAVAEPDREHRGALRPWARYSSA